MPAQLEEHPGSSATRGFVKISPILKPKDQPRKRRKPSQKLRTELKGLIREHVIANAGYQCEFCGSTTNLQAAHILSVGAHKRLEFEPYNILCLCLKDHLYGWHKDPGKYHRWLEEKFPGRYDRLLIASRCAPKVDVKLLLTVWRSNERR